MAHRNLVGRNPCLDCGDRDKFEYSAEFSLRARHILQLCLDDPRTQADLASLKTQIESGRAQMKAIQERLQPVIDEVKSIDARVEPLATQLRALDNQRKAGEQVDTRGYNAKVNEHNALLARRRALVGANRADIGQYDELEKQDSAMVKKYNALLGTTK